MTIDIRYVRTHEEYHEIEELQKAVWGGDERIVAPIHVLLTAQKHGGLLLGAYQQDASGQDQVVGFAFGFLGLTPQGKIKHCSHMLGVLPGLQGQNIGYLLKVAQRKHVLGQGIDLITWTVDPLESRNNFLNLHKLGAVCNTYYQNLYGIMEDGLNAGLPSDRFQLDWHLDRPHVADRLEGRDIPLTSIQAAQDAPILNPASDHELPRPPDHPESLNAERMLLQIPLNFQQIKLTDLQLALAWRMQVRELAEAAFAAGYLIIDLFVENGKGYYVLEKEWNPA